MRQYYLKLYLGTLNYFPNGCGGKAKMHPQPTFALLNICYIIHHQYYDVIYFFHSGNVQSIYHVCKHFSQTFALVNVPQANTSLLKYGN